MGISEVKKLILRFLKENGAFGPFLMEYDYKKWTDDKLFTKRNIGTFFEYTDTFLYWSNTRQGSDFWYKLSEKWDNFCYDNGITVENPTSNCVDISDMPCMF